MRSDRSGEYYNRYGESDHNLGFFAKFFEQYDVVAQYTVLKNLQQNSMAKRCNRTLMDMTRSMIDNSSLSLNLWGEALKTTMYILRWIPSKIISKISFGFCRLCIRVDH